VGDNESTAKINAGKSMAILIAMAMQRYDSSATSDRRYPGLHSKPLDTFIGQVPAPYHPIGRHGQRI
jgi:hypothetical protein